MSYADTEAAVIAFIKGHVPPQQPVEISAASRLQDLGLDSLDIAQLLFEAEDAFGVSFDMDRATDITCVGDVASYVLRHRPRATA